MIQKITYGDQLDHYVEKNNLIPYRLHIHSRYRTNCYYWITDENKWFKVEEVEYDFSTITPSLDHVQVVWMDNLQGYLCTDLTIYDFLLEKDKFEIRNENIINSDHSFAGGEIEYWLFRHHVNFIDKKYRGFQKYFDIRDKRYIDPTKYYFVRADYIKGEYRNVRFILDPENEKFYKPLNRNSLINESYTIRVKSDDIKKEKRRRRNKYEADRIEKQIGADNFDKRR